jgi:hypothetical protein
VAGTERGESSTEVAYPAGSPDLLSQTVAPRVKESIVHLSVAFWRTHLTTVSCATDRKARSPHGTNPVPSYPPVRHHSSAKEGDFISGSHRKTSENRRLRLAKDVQVVRRDHSMLQAIVPGVWRTAPRQLEGTLENIGLPQSDHHPY